MLTAEQLEDVIDKLILDTQDKNMGVLMGKLKSLYPGKYDGALASKLVKQKM